MGLRVYKDPGLPAHFHRCPAGHLNLSLLLKPVMHLYLILRAGLALSNGGVERRKESFESDANFLVNAL